MKKVAFISSFSDSCGNAYFTKILIESINRIDTFEAECIELDLALTQSTTPSIRSVADAHIKSICSQLKKYDKVNIQFEAGLYGSIPSDIVRRVKWLLDAHSNISITLHAPRLFVANPAQSRSVVKKFLTLRLKSALSEALQNHLASIHVRLNKKLIKCFVEKKIPLIVHTKRAKKNIATLFNYSNITVHPLKFTSGDFIPTNTTLAKIKDKLGITPDEFTIGIFGYVSAYKGHSDALKAMRLLPDNFKLLIFGRQHPQTIKQNGKVDDYLKSLMGDITKHNLQNKVFFMGELETEDFLNVASSVDICWLPYYENGQDGSGIASICFDVAQRVLCSNSFAFDELFKLIPYKNYERFDIGNYMELASKTKSIPNSASYSPQQPLNEYTLQSQAKLYSQI